MDFTKYCSRIIAWSILLYMARCDDGGGYIAGHKYYDDKFGQHGYNNTCSSSSLPSGNDAYGADQRENPDWTMTRFKFTFDLYIPYNNETVKEINTTVEDRFSSFNKSYLVPQVCFKDVDGKYEVTASLFIKSNTNSNYRLQLCQHMKDFSSIYLPSVQQKVSVTTAHECCFEEKYGEVDFKGVYTFPTTIVGVQIKMNCEYNPDQVLERSCYRGEEDNPSWNKPDLRNCIPKTKVTKDLIKLKDTKTCETGASTNCVTVVELAKNLSSTVKNGTVITNSHDVEFISDIVGNIVDKATANQSVQVTKDVIGAVNNVLDSNDSIIQTAEHRERVAARYISNLDRFAAKIGESLNKSGDEIQESTRNIGLQVSKVLLEDFYIQTEFERTKNNFSFSKNLNMSSEFKASALLRRSTFNEPGETVFAYVYRKPKFFVIQGDALPLQQTSQTVQSVVLTLSVGDEKILRLEEPVIFKFHREETFSSERLKPKNSSESCSFWETEGYWNKSGCRLVNISEDNIVTCSCTHLTSFALLFNVYNSTYDPFALQVVSWIGCGISLLGLGLTFVTHLFIRKLRSTLLSKILVSISFSLMMVLIVFISAVRKTESTSRVGCQVVSGLIQYFMLASFMWMAFTAINLFHKIVFAVRARGRNDAKFFIGGSVIAWGIPLVITIITGAAAPDSLGNEKLCVVHGNSFRYAVLMPIAIILFINIVSLVAIIVKLETGTSIAVDKTDHMKNVRIALLCATLFGITWVFAFLAIGEFGKVFQWLFCIFNSLQGFFIFVFYTVREQSFQEHLNKYCNFSPKSVTLALHHKSYRINEATSSDKYLRHHSELPSDKSLQMDTVQTSVPAETLKYRPLSE